MADDDHDLYGDLGIPPAAKAAPIVSKTTPPAASSNMLKKLEKVVAGNSATSAVQTATSAAQIKAQTSSVASGSLASGGTAATIPTAGANNIPTAGVSGGNVGSSAGSSAIPGPPTGGNTMTSPRHAAAIIKKTSSPSPGVGSQSVPAVSSPASPSGTKIVSSNVLINKTISEDQNGKGSIPATIKPTMLERRGSSHNRASRQRRDSNSGPLPADAPISFTLVEVTPLETSMVEELKNYEERKILQSKKRKREAESIDETHLGGENGETGNGETDAKRRKIDKKIDTEEGSKEGEDREPSMIDGSIPSEATPKIASSPKHQARRTSSMSEQIVMFPDDPETGCLESVLEKLTDPEETIMRKRLGLEPWKKKSEEKDVVKKEGEEEKNAVTKEGEEGKDGNTGAEGEKKEAGTNGVLERQDTVMTDGGRETKQIDVRETKQINIADTKMEDGEKKDGVDSKTEEEKKEENQEKKAEEVKPNGETADAEQKKDETAEEKKDTSNEKKDGSDEKTGDTTEEKEESKDPETKVELQIQAKISARDANFVRIDAYFDPVSLKDLNDNYYGGGDGPIAGIPQRSNSYSGGKAKGKGKYHHQVQYKERIQDIRIGKPPTYKIPASQALTEKHCVLVANLYSTTTEIEIQRRIKDSGIIGTGNSGANSVRNIRFLEHPRTGISCGVCVIESYEIEDNEKLLQSPQQHLPFNIPRDPNVFVEMVPNAMVYRVLPEEYALMHQGSDLSWLNGGSCPTRLQSMLEKRVFGQELTVHQNSNSDRGDRGFYNNNYSHNSEYSGDDNSPSRVHDGRHQRNRRDQDRQQDRNREKIVPDDLKSLVNRKAQANSVPNSASPKKKKNQKLSPRPVTAKHPVQGGHASPMPPPGTSYNVTVIGGSSAPSGGSSAPVGSGGHHAPPESHHYQTAPTSGHDYWSAPIAHGSPEEQWDQASWDSWNTQPGHHYGAAGHHDQYSAASHGHAAGHHDQYAAAGHEQYYGGHHEQYAHDDYGTSGGTNHGNPKWGGTNRGKANHGGARGNNNNNRPAGAGLAQSLKDLVNKRK